MKERPILFSTEMVQAILSGRKTQTRRLVKMPYQSYPVVSKHVTRCEFDFHYQEGVGQFTSCPYGNPGDVLWVRERFRELIDCQTSKFHSYAYYADMPQEFHQRYPHKWVPSLFMPRKACRLRLLIKNIRVERLQDISEDDAKAEGALKGIYREGPNTEKKEFQLETSYNGSPVRNHKDGFQFIWQSINGRESWDANPWVWVIEFEKIRNHDN